MTEDVRDLRSMYPFFPTVVSAELEQNLKAIKDVRAYITCPAIKESFVNKLLLRLDLTEIM